RIDAPPQPAPVPPPNASKPSEPADFASKLGAEFNRTGQHMVDHFAVEEPIAKALRSAFAAVGRRWRGEHRQPLNLLQKFLLVGAVIFLAMWFSDGDAFRILIKGLV